MTPSELSDLLWAQVDRVAPHLLPNGKKEGHEWVAGNVNGDKGNSLKVNLSGKKKWADFAEGDGGDMLDLWMACRGINLHQAMQEAKAFLGIKDDDHHFDAKREMKFSRPDRKKIARYVTRTESHLEYLQSRGISPEVVKRYEVVSGKVWNGERELDALVLPYKRDGELLQVKRISTERPDGKKVIMAEGDCEPCLFGWQALDAGVRAVVLCEGEIDCMSYAQYGISALSVPFGGGKGAKQQWIEFEYHNLDRFEEIFISMDVDDVGREAAREIASRLGEHRCRLVTLPYKDINECLMNGVTEDEIWQYIGTASYFDPEELYSAREFYQDTINAFYGKQQYLFNPPWESLADKFQFREAELTLVNGVNGHGKTEVIALNDLSQGNYEVTVDVGQSFATRRDATVKSLLSMLALIPPGTPKHDLVSSMILDNMDGEGMDDLKEYNRNQLLLSGVIKPRTPEEQQMVEQAKQQQASQPDPAMVAAQGQLLAGQAELQKAQNEQAAIQVKAFQAQTDAQVAAANVVKILASADSQQKSDIREALKLLGQFQQQQGDNARADAELVLKSQAQGHAQRMDISSILQKSTQQQPQQ